MTYIPRIQWICKERAIAVVEDAAESLGTRYIKGSVEGRHTGTVGAVGVLSFNGNKIITTGGGGMILTDDEALAERARHLTTQAKLDPVRYVHDEIGYNFRMTNIQAALGVAQLEQLNHILVRRKEIYNQYALGLQSVPGLDIAPYPSYSENNHWLNVLRIDHSIYGEDKNGLMRRLAESEVQSRPVWGLNHEQAPYVDSYVYDIKRATMLVDISLCLPSSASLTDSDFERILRTL